MADVTVGTRANLNTAIDNARASTEPDTITISPAITLDSSSTLSVAGSPTSGPLMIAGNLNGSGAITASGFTGGNTLTFSGALTQTGGFTVADASKVTLSGSYTGSTTGATLNLNGGEFTNQGSVTVTGAGDAILTSKTVATTVVNQDGARIEGAFSGIIQINNGAGGATAGGALTVTNSGLIKGTGYDGVTQHGPGTLTVTNNSSAVIYGQNTTNSLNGYGVGSDGGGRLTLINVAGGKIVGQYGVVGSNATDSITNSGTIASGSYTAGTPATITPGGIAGIQLRAGGTVTNQSGGVIDSGGRGVSLEAAGTIDNQLGGIIRHTGMANNGTGTAAGVYANGNLTLTNAGTITTAAGGGNDGVTVLGVATITNTGTRSNGTLTGGLIQADNAAGIAIAGAGSSITNSGTIQGGTSSVGVNLNRGGAVLNLAGGTIQGGGDRGITSSAALTLTNLGTISGTNDGVGVLGGGSSVLNAGTISSSMTPASRWAAPGRR